jgi:3-oxoacyl-[acyl-carrier protein] reductase
MTSSIPLQRFTNRTVIVTGGGSVFGETICRAFAAEGAAVVVAGRNGDSVERVAGSLPQAIAVTVDVTDEDQNKAMADAAVSAFGSIDVVCPNAGGAHPSMPLVDMSVQQFDEMFALTRAACSWRPNTTPRICPMVGPS